jgi:hypothetical protein
MHIKLTNGIPEKYSIGELRRDNPQTSFPRSMSDANLAAWDVYPVVPVTPPEFNPYTQRREELTPTRVSGKWTQRWQVSALSVQERDAILAERRASARLSPAQFRLALLAIGELDEVEAAIPQATREVQILWEYATEIERMHPALLALAEQLGYSPGELDALFGLT